jgi:type I restriction enzyme, R subunit
LVYTADQLNRDVVAPDQIRTVVREFRGKLFTEIFHREGRAARTVSRIGAPAL